MIYLIPLMKIVTSADVTFGAAPRFMTLSLAADVTFRWDRDVGRCESIAVSIVVGGSGFGIREAVQWVKCSSCPNDGSNFLVKTQEATTRRSWTRRATIAS